MFSISIIKRNIKPCLIGELPILFMITFLFLPSFVTAKDANELPDLKGKILLQVESRGEAWYINPSNNKKYHLGSPTNAFNMIQELGVGITNSDLAKIPLGHLSQFNSPSKTAKTSPFIKKNLGKFFLQVESRGEAWYLNPIDMKRYYLGRPYDAFMAIKKFGIGITDKDLQKISTGYLSKPALSDSGKIDELNITEKVGKAIRQNKVDEVVKYFIPDLKKTIEYTMLSLNEDSKLSLGNLFSGAVLDSANENEKIYVAKAYFSLGGYEVKIYFHLQKQPDGRWLLANL